MKQMIINAIFNEAKNWTFSSYDKPTENDIDEATETLYQFVKGMMVFMSEDMKTYSNYIYSIYAFEIRTGKRYDTEMDIPHLV